MPFAFLEMKVPNLLSQAEFQDTTAMAVSRKSRTELERGTFKRTELFWRTMGRSLSSKSEIKDAALFDWKHMNTSYRIKRYGVLCIKRDIGIQTVFRRVL